MSAKSTEFHLVPTEDGSPTVESVYSDGRRERMHHSKGAFSESVYIYLQAMKEASNRGWPLNTLSVGLGLGYNELLWAGWICLCGQLEKSHLHSYEIEPVLREEFLAWLKGQERSPWAEAYNTILDLTAEHLSLAPQDIRRTLVEQRESGRWLLSEEFGAGAKSETPYTCILYDAFSGKMTPELWEEQALIKILSTLAARQSVFATYAATGNLNRALRSHNFELIRREGFGGKRQSTLAVRLTTPS